LNQFENNNYPVRIRGLVSVIIPAYNAEKLYDGELLFNEMCALLSEKGYALIEIERGFSDPVTSKLLQVDGISHRL
jgi:hypothetical protein